MKIDARRLDAMFDFAKVNKDKLHDSLRKMGTKQLKSEMRKEWSPENPTRCFCYVVSECIFWYVAPENTIPFSLSIENDPWIHRYLRWPCGTIVDLTADQFDNYELVDYNLGIKRMFLQTGCKGPSKRARLLAELMEYGTIIDK